MTTPVYSTTGVPLYFLGATMTEGASASVTLCYTAPGRVRGPLPTMVYQLTPPPPQKLVYWTGAVDLQWGEAGNWDIGFVPDADADVIIDVARPTSRLRSHPETTRRRASHLLRLSSSSTAPRLTSPVR